MKKLLVAGSVSFLLLGLTACETQSQPKAKEPIVTTPVVDRTPPAVPVETKPAPAPAPVPVVPVEQSKPIVNLTERLDETHAVNGPVRVYLNQLYDMTTDSLLSPAGQETAYMIAAMKLANDLNVDNEMVTRALLQLVLDRGEEGSIHQWATGSPHALEQFFLAELGMTFYEEANKDRTSSGHHLYQICLSVMSITMSTAIGGEIDLDKAYQKIDEHLAQL